MHVELLWFEGCPNHVAARDALEHVLAARGLSPADITSVLVDEASAEPLRFPGSPTIRIDGHDVEPGYRESGAYALSCRMYLTPDGPRGAPPVEWIEQAVDAAIARDGA